MRKSFLHIWAGIAFVLLGALAILDRAGAIDLNVWKLVGPAVLFIVGLEIVTSHYRSLPGYILLAAGAYLAAKVFFKDLPLGWEYIAPGIAVLIGFSLIFNAGISSRQSGGGSAIFSSRKLQDFPLDWSGQEMSAIFGGYETDLRTHTFTNDAHIRVLALFGGVEILVPEHVNIVIRPVSIFGGVTNKTVNSNHNSHTLYITATAVFGGVEIKNAKD